MKLVGVLLLLSVCFFVGGQEIRIRCLYFIKPGDTLTTISQKFGVSIDAILAANVGNPAVVNRDLIWAGYPIVIPNRTPRAVSGYC